MESTIGFRFHPTNEEIINHFLRNKRLDRDYSVHTINEIDIYKFEPSDLPELSSIELHEPEWYFFCALDYKNTKNKCAKRSTESGSGYWKITGKDHKVKTKRSKQVIGTKKTLVFYQRNHGSKDTRTNWVMHEYHSNPDPLFKEAFVICRIKRKPDRSPNNATPPTNDQPHHDVENIFLEKENLSLPIPDQTLPNHYMVSDFRNGVAENTNPSLPSDHYMVSSLGNGVAENDNQSLSNHYMVSDLGNDLAENTNLSLPNHYIVSDLGNDLVENTNLSLLNHYMVSDLGNGVAENTNLSLPNHCMVSDLGNGVADNDNQPLLDHYMVSDLGNGVAENTNLSLPNHYMVSDLGNGVADNDNQPLLDHYMVSDLSNDVVENTTPPLPNHYTISSGLRNGIAKTTNPSTPNHYKDSDLRSLVAETTFRELLLQVEPLILARSNAPDDNDELGHNSILKKQLPIQSEQESSYSSGFSNEFNVSNSTLHIGQEDDFWTWHWDVRGEYSSQALCADFNSSESVGGVHGRDSSDTDTETVSGGVNEYPSIVTKEFHFDSPYNPQSNFMGEYNIIDIDPLF